MSVMLSLKRFRRGLAQIIHFVVFEYPRGINISLRSKSSGITLSGNHGYALTSKAALKNILRGIALDGKYFLDVGSGKGGAILFAHDLGCAKADGIEYERFLHEIAVKNISVLRRDSFCTSINVDARRFDRYADYDIIFMFNPFSREIFKDVAQRIVSQFNNSEVARDRYVILYGGLDSDVLLRSGGFKLIRQEECPYRGNQFKIFRFTHD